MTDDARPTEALLARAAAGDGPARAELFERYREILAQSPGLDDRSGGR
jgi:hypothetical protein